VEDRQRRDLYNGFGEGLQQAFEFAAVPAVFGVGGLLLDGWLGTLPLFTILLGLFGVVGTFVRMWIHYDARMRREEAARSAGARARSGAVREAA
jgi:F0F1-type ATP synthase assembly protein I